MRRRHFHGAVGDGILSRPSPSPLPLNRSPQLLSTLVSGLLLLAAPALAEWNFYNPLYATFVTGAELDTLSGFTGSNPIALAIDTDGSILVINDPLSEIGVLVDIAPGGGPHGSVVANESLLTAATPDPGDTDLDVNRLLVASDGTLFLAETQGDDDLLQVARGAGGPAAAGLAVLNGLMDIALDEGNHRLFALQEASFGASADAVRLVDLPEAFVSDAATADQIHAATSAAGAWMNTGVLLPGGEFAFYDEAFFGGSDGIFTLETPGPSPTIHPLHPASFFPCAPGLANLTVTPQGDLLGWNQTPASGTSCLTIIPNGALGPADAIDIPVDTIKAGLGLPPGDSFRPDNQGSLAVDVEAGPPGRIVLYMAESRNHHAIFTMTFPEYTPGVRDWALY